MNAPIPTDLQLSARLDGELDPAEAAKVDAWLQQHPEGAERVQAWARDRDALRAHFDPVLDEPLPPALQLRLWADAGPQRAWTRVAAVAGLLLLGGFAGGAGVWQWQQHAQPATSAGWAHAAPGWPERAMLAHSVYVPEKRHPVEVGAQEDHLARWLTRRTELPVKLFDLHAQGFELMGGRLLPDDAAGPSAQLMYQDAAGTRVTVYLRKADQSAPAAFRYERQGELGLFYWVEGRAGYALVGSLPRERLLALAEAIYHQQPDGGAASAAAR